MTAAKRRTYSDEERAEAVQLASEIGLAKACKSLGLAKSTLKTWTDNAGVAVATPAQAAAVEAATRVSVVNRHEAAERAREELVDSLTEIAKEGTALTLQLLRDPWQEYDEVPARALKMKLPEIVGAWTRAVHDLSLLSGKPTEIVADIDVVELQRLRDEYEAGRRGGVPQIGGGS